MTYTRADHAANPTKYPICPAGHVWRQHGNTTGHCSRCHTTYEGINLFDRHQTINPDGTVTCRNPQDITLGRNKTPLENHDGAWRGPRMDQNTIAARFGRPAPAETAIQPDGDGPEAA